MFFTFVIVSLNNTILVVAIAIPPGFFKPFFNTAMRAHSQVSTHLFSSTHLVFAHAK